MNFTSDISIKIRTAIKVKLAELGTDVYEELPDYIMVMVANRRNEEDMTEELSLFLGDNAPQFTSWLHSLLSKLQFVASAPPESKGNLASGSRPSTEQNKSAGATPSYSDSASEHSNDEDASRAVPSRSEALKSEQASHEEDEQSDSPKSNSSSVDHADSTSRGSSNEPSNVTCDSDSVKTENSKTDNGTRKEVVKKRKKTSVTRVFRVKSRKLESESDSSGKSNIVSSSKLATEQGTDASDSEKETKSYTQIRKMKPSNHTSSEVSSSVVKTKPVESESGIELEGKDEKKSERNHDLEIDTDDSDQMKKIKLEIETS